MLKKVNLQKFKKFNFQEFQTKMVDLGNLVEDSFLKTLMPLLLDVEKEYNKAKSQLNLKVKLTTILKII